MPTAALHLSLTERDNGGVELRYCATTPTTTRPAT